MSTYLDSISPTHTQVGYGELGMGGSLGYEGKSITVRGVSYAHALSAHATSRVQFKLDGRYASFRCQVALNDDVSSASSRAHFLVLADGRQVAAATYVVTGESPRTVSACIRGAQTLELVVLTSQWEYCHAVWLDPQVEEGAAHPPTRTLVDCLGRTEIILPMPMPHAERCIASVVSPGFEKLLDHMLHSLQANGKCDAALLVVFVVDGDEACKRVAEKYGAILIPCRRRSLVNVTVKSLLYSLARVVDAGQFLCLDADMLILGDLSPVFAALDACADGSILVCREANYQGFNTLDSAIRYVYRGGPQDLQRLGVRMDTEASYPLVVNDGIFAGGQLALLDLDGVIRAMPQASAWVDERRHFCWWGNQFIFNLALARLHCGVRLDDVYNIQLHTQDLPMWQEKGRVSARWHGRSVRVVHFCGVGKQKYPMFLGS